MGEHFKKQWNQDEASAQYEAAAYAKTAAALQATVDRDSDLTPEQKRFLRVSNPQFTSFEAFSDAVAEARAETRAEKKAAKKLPEKVEQEVDARMKAWLAEQRASEPHPVHLGAGGDATFASVDAVHTAYIEGKFGSPQDPHGYAASQRYQQALAKFNT